MSPLSGLYIPEVPPAPPSTPASTVETKNLSLRDFGLATPLPYSAGFVQNTHHLEQQQLLADGAVTPAPPRPERAVGPTSGGSASTGGGTTAHSHPRNPHDNLDNDLSDWAVGERYKLLRMLGRGSYGEVAQAQDLSQGREDALVAIKRIQSPFEQEMDAVRLYREIHILRRLRGQDCIIKLLDVVQPPSDDLADFHDLYLVFEYVDTDLYKLIMSPQYLLTEHIQTFLYQMLIGLKYIHSASVIHRDLKPANILLNEDCSLKVRGRSYTVAAGHNGPPKRYYP
jgi:mitogen-activated protein kinase 1/3